jgi:hypothetical protein
MRQGTDKTDQPHAEFTTRCRLKVDGHPKGLLISCRDATITPEFRGELAAVSDFLRIAAEFDWLVTRGGEFVGLTNTDRMMAAYWKMPGPATVESEKRKHLVDVSLSAADADARSTWSMLVEAWMGATLTLGEEISGTDDMEIPLAPGARVRSRQTVRAERWLDCPSRSRLPCIELHVKTLADPADFAAALERVFERNATKPLGARVSLATFSREVVLITEPTTLTPYTLNVRTWTSTRAGNDKVVNQVVEKAWTFKYP